MKPVLAEHLHADEGENDRQAVLEQVKSLDHRRQQKVQRAQPEHSEDVRGEYDEWISSNAEDRRNGVDREHEVREFDEHEDEQQRRRHLSARLEREEVLAVEVS